MGKLGIALVRAYLVLLLLFLYLPIAVMVAMAFNQSALYQLPFVFDLKWFAALSDNQRSSSSHATARL